MKVQLYTIIASIALIAYFLPIIILVIRKKTNHRPLLLFGFYWSLTGIFNLLGKLPFIEPALLEKITVVYNMLDIPAVLWMLCFTTALPKIRTFTSRMAPILVIVQVLTFTIQGWNYKAATYTLPIGLLTVLIVLFWEVYHFMDQIEHTAMQNAMIFMHSSLLFAYGSFVLVYIFDYCIKIGTVTDSYLIYYISTLIALSIALLGIVKRFKEKPAYATLQQQRRKAYESSSSSW